MWRPATLPRPGLHPAGVLLAIGIAALPLLHLLLAWRSNGEMLQWLLDDAAYDTMRHAGSLLGRGYGSVPGNGVPSLWLLPVTVLGLISGGSPTAFFLLVMIALAAINTAVLYVFCRRFGERLGYQSALLALLFIMVTLPEITIRGSETVLLLPALYLLFCRLSAGGMPWQSRDSVTLGLALAWLVLVRLDSLVLVLVLLAWVALCLRPGWRAMLVLMLPSALALLSLATINLACYGALLPASLATRALGTPWLANFSVYADMLSWWMKPGILALSAVWLLAELIYRRRRPAGHALALLGVSLLALFVQVGLYAACSGWALAEADAYLMVAVLLAMILRVHALASGVAGQAVRGGRLALRRLLSLVLLLGAGVALPGWYGGPADAAMVRNQRDIAAGVFAGKTIIMGEHAGSVSFWVPSARVVQPDGRGMPPAFMNSMRHGRGGEWIDLHHAVDALVVDRPWLPTMHYGGDRVYLVIEPVRARLWQDHVLIYCFPQFAVLDEQQGDDFSRLRFDYAERMTCPQPLMAWANEVNSRAQLFQLSRALRPEGLAERLAHLDHWLARLHQVPAPLTQPDTDPK